MNELIPQGTTTYLHLTRRVATENSVIGDLELKSFCPHAVGVAAAPTPDEIFKTLEKAWRGNAVSLSCIPPGIHRIIYRDYGTFWEKYNRMYGHLVVLEIDGVPGRTAILIHIGNTEADSEGCICIGQESATPDRIDQSVNNYKRFIELVQRKRPTHIIITQEIAA